jgi:hypothetical protein
MNSHDRLSLNGGLHPNAGALRGGSKRPRCVGPQHARDLGLRAEVERSEAG